MLKGIGEDLVVVGALPEIRKVDDAYYRPALSLQRLHERPRDVFVHKERKATGHSVAGLNPFAFGFLPQLLVLSERSIDLFLVIVVVGQCCVDLAERQGTR